MLVVVQVLLDVLEDPDAGPQDVAGVVPEVQRQQQVSILVIERPPEPEHQHSADRGRVEEPEPTTRQRTTSP